MIYSSFSSSREYLTKSCHKLEKHVKILTNLDDDDDDKVRIN